MQLPKTFRLLLTLSILLLAAETLQADPLRFSNVVGLQNGGSTRVDLFSHPGTVLTGPNISFLIDITGNLPAAGTDSLQVTFGELGRAPIVRTYQLPLFGSIPPPFTQLVTFFSETASIQGAEAWLKLDFLNTNPDFVIPGGPGAGSVVDSYTYHFRVSSPVPEPASLLLVITGLSGLAVRFRRVKR